MKPPFSYKEWPSPLGYLKCEYRVADANDDRVATCWDEENARELVKRLNAPAKVAEVDAGLRDTFAAHALTGILAAQSDPTVSQLPSGSHAAGMAYRYADAMLAERAKGGAK